MNQVAGNPEKILSNTDQMELECQRVIAGIRGSLLELYAALGVDPAQPQEAIRKFRVNKNLAWKVSKILSAEDGLSTVQHFPGGAGWEIMLGAIQEAGGPDLLLSRVRAALDQFDVFVARHAGTRTNLELILDSMGLSGGGGQLEASRQMAFQGNSGIWGVQVRTRMTSAFVVPSKTPGRVDAALIGGLLGFRCLRQGVSWPLFRFQSYNDDGTPRDRTAETVEENDGSSPLPALIRRFSSPNLPPIKSVRIRNSVEHSLQPTTVGNLGAFDCYFGDILRGESRYRDEINVQGEFASSVTLPLENLVFDLFVHRELEMPEPPTVVVYGRPAGGPDDPSAHRESFRIPIPERCVEMVGRPPVVVTPLMPRYPELVAMVTARLGSNLADFRGFRATLKFPPMPATVVLRWPLPEAPKG